MASTVPQEPLQTPQDTLQQLPPPAQTDLGPEGFKLTPDQVLELQFARLRAQQLRSLSEDELAHWKGEDYDPQRERSVLTAGFSAIAATVVGVASLAGWQMSKNYMVEEDGVVAANKGLKYKFVRYFQPHKLVNEMDAQRVSSERAQQIAQLDLIASGKAVPNGASIMNNISSSNANSLKGQILHQELPPGAPTIQPPPQRAPVAIPASYQKFTRKTDGSEVDPALRPAYDYKQAKLNESKEKGIRGRKYKSIASIPTALRKAASSRAGLAFVLSTIGLSAAAFGITRAVCNWVGIKDYNQYSDWMRNEEASYRPQDLVNVTQSLSKELRRALWGSPLKALMSMMSEQLQKENHVSFADIQILDQASIASAYFLGYECDIYNKFTGKPSRAMNPSLDEFTDAFTQPIPASEQEYHDEQLKLLRQLAGLPQQPQGSSPFAQQSNV